jgi:hypothetical protein
LIFSKKTKTTTAAAPSARLLFWLGLGFAARKLPGKSVVWAKKSAKSAWAKATADKKQTARSLAWAALALATLIAGPWATGFGLGRAEQATFFSGGDSVWSRHPQWVGRLLSSHEALWAAYPAGESATVKTDLLGASVGAGAPAAEKGAAGARADAMPAQLGLMCDNGSVVQIVRDQLIEEASLAEGERSRQMMTADFNALTRRIEASRGLSHEELNQAFDQITARVDARRAANAKRTQAMLENPAPAIDVKVVERVECERPSLGYWPKDMKQTALSVISRNGFNSPMMSVARFGAVSGERLRALAMDPGHSAAWAADMGAKLGVKQQRWLAAAAHDLAEESGGGSATELWVGGIWVWVRLLFVAAVLFLAAAIARWTAKKAPGWGQKIAAETKRLAEALSEKATEWRELARAGRLDWGHAWREGKAMAKIGAQKARKALSWKRAPVWVALLAVVPAAIGGAAREASLRITFDHPGFAARHTTVYLQIKEAAGTPLRNWALDKAEAFEPNTLVVACQNDQAATQARARAWSDLHAGEKVSTDDGEWVLVSKAMRKEWVSPAMDRATAARTLCVKPSLSRERPNAWSTLGAYTRGRLGPAMSLAGLVRSPAAVAAWVAQLQRPAADGAAGLSDREAQAFKAAFEAERMEFADWSLASIGKLWFCGFMQLCALWFWIAVPLALAFLLFLAFRSMAASAKSMRRSMIQLGAAEAFARHEAKALSQAAATASVAVAGAPALQSTPQGKEARSPARARRL